MTQTLAIFVDAYRQLNARKLFWVTLILSGVVVAAFAMVGITDKGVKILVWDLNVSWMSTNVISTSTFYKTLFTTLGINIWLTWAASILALISTAGIVPDLLASGSVELTLSKPISRARVFLTTYVAGLLFVALQVTVFSALSFLVLGVRGNTWEPRVLLAVPVVVVFFSYLFAICALLGLLTRSTVAALLLTILAWLLIFAIHGSESLMLTQRLISERTVARSEARVDAARQGLERLAGSTDPAQQADADRLKERLETASEQLAERQKSLDNWTRFHRLLYGVKTLLPKTTETVGLLERWTIKASDMPQFDESQLPPVPEGDEGSIMRDPKFARELEQTVRNRPVGWIMGTSLLFEAIVLGIATFIFCRSDY